MATSINVETTKSGTKKQKAISFIDPNSSYADLIAFGRGITSLMADADYASTTRIDKINCDTTPQATRNVEWKVYLKNSQEIRTTDSVINVNLDDLDAGNVIRLAFYNVGGLQDTARLMFSNFKTSNGSTATIDATTNYFYANSWTANIQTVVEAKTITFELSMAKTEVCAAYNQTYTLNIYQGGN